MNTELKVKPSPKDDKAVYSQTLAMPIHMKQELLLELVLKAQTWNHHSAAFPQVRKFHFCTVEAHWKIRCSCGSRENQQTACG